MAQPGVQMAMRLSPEILARVDAIAEKLSTDASKRSRSEVIRECLLRGLPVYEAETERVIAARDGEPVKKRR